MILSIMVVTEPSGMLHCEAWGVLARRTWRCHPDRDELFPSLNDVIAQANEQFEPIRNAKEKMRLIQAQIEALQLSIERFP